MMGAFLAIRHKGRSHHRSHIHSKFLSGYPHRGGSIELPLESCLCVHPSVHLCEVIKSEMTNSEFPKVSLSNIFVFLAISLEEDGRPLADELLFIEVSTSSVVNFELYQDAG